MIAAGGLSGGISSTIAGGDFWQGMRQGLITSGLNHVLHMGADGLDQENPKKKTYNEKTQQERDYAYMQETLLPANEFMLDAILFVQGAKGLWGLTTVLKNGWKALGTSSKASIASKTETSLVTQYPSVGEVAGTVERTFLMPGQVIDRYGSMGGRWFSIPGTSYGARSIPPGLSPYTQFKVLKPFEVKASLSAPGMFSGQTGFGIQFQSSVRTDILIKRGIITPF